MLLQHTRSSGGAGDDADLPCRDVAPGGTAQTPLPSNSRQQQQKMPPMFESVLQALQPCTADCAEGARAGGRGPAAPGAASGPAPQPPAAMSLKAAADVEGGQAQQLTGAAEQARQAQSPADAAPARPAGALQVVCPRQSDTSASAAAAAAAVVTPAAGSLVENIFGDVADDARCLLLDDDISLCLSALRTPRDDNPQTRAERRSLRLLLGLLGEPAAADSCLWAQRRTAAQVW